MNTRLLNSDFLKELTEHLTAFSSPHPHQSNTQHWDRVKTEIKRFCISASIKRKQDQQSAIRELNIQRQNKLAQLSLASGATKDTIILELEALESTLQHHTSEDLDAYALRSGTLWREQGEGNTSYFFRAISQRNKKRLVPHLLNPATNALTTTTEERLNVATDFYSQLYSCDPSDQDATNQLLNAIPPQAILSDQDSIRLQRDVTPEEIDDVVSRSPLSKAPGKDGLPFELYRHILLIPWIKELFTTIINDALTHATFPASWQETVMILLFKKGDATKLANWRPLSLINSDAKLFTKILTLRIQPHMSKLTGAYQTGFTAGRHIADNGLVLTTLREYCNTRKTKHVGILLDQEKAYDRVHPIYLRQVLRRFGFPSSVIESVVQLFFSTKIALNINGFVSDTFPQSRGLRQGDPLSPLLFNLAFEPLLAFIQQSPTIHGIEIPGRTESIKLGAYADDLMTIISTTAEWIALENCLQTYGRASNAKVNLSKTVAFPMAPSYSIELQTRLEQLHIQWHDHNSADALIYLGFPIPFNHNQEQGFWDKMLKKIQSTIAIHSSRSLSVLGRATIVNSLILSRLWHLSWVVKPPPDFLRKVKSAVSSFVCSFKPRPSWEVITTPRDKGGLGVIDPAIQGQVFQLKHIRNALATNISWGKDIILDIIRWKTKTSHRLAFLLAPVEGQYRSLLAGFPSLQRLVTVASSIPSLKALALADTLPDSATLASSPIEWWFETTDTTIKALRLRVEDLFQFSTNDNGLLRLVRRTNLTPKLRLIQVELGIQAYQERRLMRHNMQQALSNPPKLTQEDTLAQRILSSVLLPSTKNPITLELATTKHLRTFLRQDTPPDPNSSTHPEAGSLKQWRRFWRAKIPHRARTMWWRFKRDWLPCGTLRHKIWKQEPHCSMAGCRERHEDKTHHIFQCTPKYIAWQTILKQHTSKTVWSDDDLHKVLSFQPPSFDIKPQFNITIPQLLACCLIGISTANTVLFLHQHTQSSSDIIHTILQEIQKTIAQNNFLKAF